MTRLRPVLVVGMGVLLIAAGGMSVALAAPGSSSAPADADGQAHQTDQTRSTSGFTLGLDRVSESGAAQVGSSSPMQLSNETQAAARDGVAAGARLARDRGVAVSDSRVQEATESVLRAADANQNASADAIRTAAQGASHGAFIQGQSVNTTQIQASVYGSTAGALSESQEANVTHIQSAAYGAAHGSSAQYERANVTQLQSAAMGAAAGATRQATESGQSSVTQVQEAAQGASYGALDQRQTVNASQIQAAAFGAAGGATERTDGSATDPKKVQEAAMGAAKGVLVQDQQASPSQIQAAAHGASRGALVQSQFVSVTQIQEAAYGAAGGSISQFQSASVVQIQAAAFGAASGSLTQVQTVEVIQVQHAAFGAAKGAAGAAAQYQVTTVQQIQAAAAGAGQGATIQIQQVTVAQVQSLAAGAASGALSQYQQASIVQIRSAARGASEGALTVTQIQIVSVTQIQIRSERAAADAAGAAARTDVDHDTKIYKKAKGDVSDTDPDDEADLGSLFFEVQNETLFLANPNDVSVTVTVTSDGETADTITVAPGESLTRDFDPGVYVLTAESQDGRTVEFAGRERLRIAIGEERRSLTATVDDGTLTVANVNDVDAWVTVRQDGARVVTFHVGPTGDRTWDLDPGTYTVAAEIDGEAVPVNDQDAAQIEVQEDRIPLSVSVANESIAVTNPTELAATVAVTDDATGNATAEIEVGPEAAERQSLDPGDYTLTGQSETDAAVTLNGQSELAVTVTGTPNQTANLSVEIVNATDSLQAGDLAEVTAAIGNDGAADGQATATLELENGTEVDTVTTDVGAGQTEQVALSYQTGEADVGTQNLTVRVDGATATTVLTVTEVPNRTATLQVEDQTGDGERLQVANATAGIPFYVEARYGGNATQSPTIDAGGALSNDSLALDPPLANDTVVSVAIRAAEDDAELAVEAIDYTLEEPPTEEPPTEEPATQEPPTEEPTTEQPPTEEPIRKLSSCTVVSEPGAYALTGNLSGAEGDACVEIQSSDVRLDGQGYAIWGPGNVTDASGQRAPIGILANNTAEGVTGDGPNLENVSVENVTVSGWNRGVAGGASNGVNLTVANSTLRANWAGADFNAGSWQFATFENVTFAENEAYGATHGDEGNGVLAVRNSTVASNGQGLSVADSTPLVVESSTIRDNEGVGVSAVNLNSDASTIANSTVAGNDGSGIRFGTLGPFVVENTTVSDNDGTELSGWNVSIADLRVDGAASVATLEEFAGALDATDREALPVLPNGTTALGRGLNVTSPDSLAMGTLEATFGYEQPAADSDVELWRQDGTTWAQVETDAPPANGSLRATIDQPGRYVPVSTTSASGVNATVGNQAVWIENPTAGPVTATVESETGATTSVTVDPGGNQSMEAFSDGQVVLQPGNYTLTATDDGGEAVPVEGNSSYAFALPPGLDSLTMTSTNGTVNVTNPNDETVDVTVFIEAETFVNASIPPDTTQELATADLDPGTYQVFATTPDDRRVPVNDGWTASVDVTAATLDPIGVSVEDGNVTFDNQNDAAVRVTVTNGVQRDVLVPATSTATATLEPGTYNASAVMDADGTSVQIESQNTYTFTIAQAAADETGTATATSTPLSTPTPTPSPTTATPEGNETAVES